MCRNRRPESKRGRVWGWHGRCPLSAPSHLLYLVPFGVHSLSTQVLNMIASYITFASDLHLSCNLSHLLHSVPHGVHLPQPSKVSPFLSPKSVFSQCQI